MRLRNDFKNPYANTVQCIISEILQLLLIVERIKADEEAIRRLRTLVSIYEKFNELSEPYPQYFLYENKANSAQVLLCDVLDQGLKATFFLIKIIDFVESQPLYRRSENRDLSRDDPRIDSWHKNLSKIIDSEQYGFENLSPWRLHYPHQQIVQAYLHGEELIKKVNQLKQLDFKESINIASDLVIDEYSNAFGSGVDKEVKELILEQHINSRAAEGFVKKMSFIIDDITRMLSWSFEEGHYFANHTIEKRKKEMGGAWRGRGGKQSVLTIDVLESEIKAAIEKNELYLISKKIIYSMAHEVYPDKYKSKFKNDIINKVELFDVYERYAYLSSSVQLLGQTDDTLRIHYNVLRRGLEFSIWREKQVKEVRKRSVLDLTNKYKTEKKGEDCLLGSPTTIKQSYEAVKGYSKRSRGSGAKSPLVKLIHAQMTIRWLTYYPRVRFLFAPFNIHYEDKVRGIAEKLRRIDGNSYTSYRDVCSFFENKLCRGMSVEHCQVGDDLQQPYTESDTMLNCDEIKKLLDEDILISD